MNLGVILLVIVIAAGLPIAIVLLRNASLSGLAIDPLSSAIVVASGSALIIAGAYHRHDGTSMFLITVGCLVGLLALVTWLGAGCRRDDPGKKE